MPKSRKRPAARGKKKDLPETIMPTKQGFDPRQGRLPTGLKIKTSTGGRPMLFPGRTGGR